MCRLIWTLHFRLQSRWLRLPQKFVSGVIGNLRICVLVKRFVRLSQLCDVSLTFLLQPLSGEVDCTYRFPSNVVGFHEYVRHAGSNAGFTSVKDVAQFSSRHSFVYPVVVFLGRRLLVLLWRSWRWRGTLSLKSYASVLIRFCLKKPLSPSTVSTVRTHIKILPIRRRLQRAVQYEDKVDNVKCNKWMHYTF